MCDSHPQPWKRHKDTITEVSRHKVKYQLSCCSGVAQHWKRASSA